MNNFFNLISRYITILLLSFLFLYSNNTFAQLTGTKSIPGDYASIALAITDLNLQGVGTGGVTFNVAAGHSETISDSLRLTATGTAGNPIIFQKSGAGANPIITRTDAGFISTSTLGAQGDAVIIIQGSDYVTFDGIDVAASNEGIEYGYFIRKASDTDGSKFITIKNSNITMTKGVSQFVVGIYSSNLVESSPNNIATGITVSSVGGRNESITLTGNTISNVFCGIVLRGFNQTTAPREFYDFNFIVGAPGQGNIINNFAGNATGTAYGIYMIYHNNLSIAYNTINNTAGGGSGFTSTGYGIFTSTATSSSVDINNNNITLTSVATTSALHGINNGAGATAAGNTININNNVVTNCVYNTATTGLFNGILNSASAEIVNINNNAVTNNTHTGTGTVTLVDAGSPTIVNMANNVVTGNSKNGASGSFFCMRAGTAIVTFNNNTIHSNTFDGTSGTTSAIMYGYYNLGSPTEEYIYNNEIYNLSVTGTNSSTTSVLYGIHSNTVATAVKEIYNNTIHSLSALSGTVYGISQLLGANVKIFKNNIYNLSNQSNVATAARVVGIQISSGTVYAYNNFVSDLRAPNVTLDDAIRGIASTSTTTNSTIGLYYNTVFLNASAGGTNFGSSGIFHTFSTTATSATLDMRNNVVINLSTPFGTGRTVAFRRSAATNLNNYSELSNNNDFYAGTPGANNLIFFDGTNADQLLSDFKLRVSPRETFSFTENPPFLNVTTAPYNLRMNTTVPTQVESGGIPISSPLVINDDFDGNSRNATTPDVGANEFNGIGADFTPPTITFTPLLNTGSLTNRALVVTVTDPSGVPTTAPGWPHLYFRVNTGSWTPVTPSNVAGSNYTFNFGGGVSIGDVVQYYVVAQDVPGNVTSNPFIGAGGFTSNPPAAATPPTNPESYTIVNTPLAGNYTIGVAAFRQITGRNITLEKNVNRVLREVWVEIPLTEEELRSEEPIEPRGYFQQVEVDEITWLPYENGKLYQGELYVKKNENPDLNFADGIEGIYITITSAVADLNTRGVSAPTTFLLDDAAYPTETFPITIDITNEAQPSAANPVTFRPNAGVVTTVSGESASAIFKLNGADYITFDGSNSGGTSRNWTIENTSTATNTTVFWIASIGEGEGSTNNTIKNCVIKAGSNTVTSTFGIYAAGTTISTTGIGASNDNLIIQNNEITKSYRAVYVRGTTTSTGRVEGLFISENIIGSSVTTDYVTFRGIDVANATAPIISRNNLFNIIIDAGASNAAIDIGTNVMDALISRNYINVVQSNSSGGWGAYGINISSGTGTSGAIIVNNFVAGVSSYGFGTGTTFNPFGIRITGGTNHKVYYNSVNSFGSFGGAVAYMSAALLISSNTATGLDIRNNIFSNSITGADTTRSFAVYAVSGTTFGNINNNNYFVSGANGVLGFLGVNVPTLSGWKAATGQDANSHNINPPFASSTDLHINAGLTPTVLESGGAVIPGYTIDFDGDLRPGPAGSVNGGAIAPDIGADEFDGVLSPIMTYISSTVTQDNVSFVLSNTTNNEIIGIRIVTNGTVDPLILQSLDFTTAGTTNLADISNAKVWYTGTNATFATTNQFGSTLTTPTAGFTITGSQALSEGTNYFWLTFDVVSGASSGNTVDAQCNNIVLSSVSHTPTVTNPAGSRTILGALSGAYNVGAGEAFTTITSAVTALNTVGISGAVTFNLTDANYSSGETFPIVINEITGASAVNTITIKPASGVNSVISGSSASSLIRINGADYVTIDGSNSGTSSRNLTIQNNSTATNTTVIWISSLGTGAGAENNTIKNCTIIGGSNTVISQFGIYAAGSSVSTTGSGAGNSNLTIQNNSIQKAHYGIFVRGIATTGVTSGLVISNNSIGSEVAENYIGRYGLDITQADGAVISGNTIFNFIGTVINPTGMLIGSGFINSTISANKIFNISYTGTSGYGGKGIDINTGNIASNVNIVNNVIYNITGDGWSTLTSDAIVGIRILGGSGGFNIYYNSVNLSGNSDRSATATVCAAFYSSTTAAALDIRNNVFSNSIVNNLNAGAKSYAIYNAAASAVYSTINYNDYFASGVQGILGFFTSDINSIADWRTATGQDVNSFSANPLFNSNSNLIPLPGSPLIAAGTPIGGVTTDFLGVLRNGTTPSIGAYENAADAVGPVIVYVPLTNTNSLLNRTLSNVDITDISGVNVTGFKPRIYFKKSTDANVFGGNTSVDNGWKWTETAQTSSPFSFVINYGLLFGGSASAGDSIQYFVTAQDLASVPNVSANPSSGFSATSVASIVTGPITPNVYKLVGAPMAGDYTVGLAAFNMANNKNLVQEARTRIVLIEVPVEEIVPINSITSVLSINNVDNAIDVISEDDAVQNSFSSIKSTVETADIEPVYESTIRFETVEVEEEYTVLLENGELFEWKSYYERLSEDFVEGIYPTISSAVADLLERGVSAPVRFLLVDASYTEAYPIVLREFVGASSSNTVTFKPQTGVSPVISATSPTVAMFQIDGGDYYVFDGSNSSGGTSKDLTITNSSATIPIFRIENGATNNTLKNLVINGQLTSTVNGLIALLSTTTSTGNTHNSFVNNSFNDVSGSRAANYIYSSGSAVAPNSNTTITGNEFKNFTSAGVRGATGSGGNWNISNNHFFNVISASTALSPITLTPGITSGGNNIISGNFIGGSAPNAAGDPLVVTSASSFAGITVGADSLTASVVNNNVIKNISLQNTGTHTFNGINITGGLVNITNNTVGDNSTANSILVAGSSTTMGINYTLPAGFITGPAVISGNLVANLTATGTGTSVAVRGIHNVCTLRVDILGNIVHTLTSSGSMAALTGNNQTAVGINAWQQTYLGSIVEGNTIYNITAANTGAFSTHATGIFTTNLDGAVSKNRIYNITNLSTGTTATAPPTASGIFLRFTLGGAIANNMISIGNDFANNVQVNGIFNPANGPETHLLYILYNSIRISGTVSTGSHSSFGFLRGDNAGSSVTTTVGLRNNIFDNQRSGGDGKHYALGNQVTNTLWTAESSDYNLLNTSNVNTVGFWNGLDRTFEEWQSSSGGDANSFSGVPVNYVNIATADLHLNMGTTPTVLESGGTVIPGLTEDFDGDVRPGPAGSVNGGATAPDIGADEFDGVPASQPTFQLSVDVANGWNMVSIPGLHPVDQNVNTWWAGKDPAAGVFRFAGGYQAVTTVAPGTGYWMKHVGANTYNTGDEWPAGGIQIVPNDPIPGVTGWNLIGGYHLTVATSGITTTPGGLQSGSVFGYTPGSGYLAAANLVPGYGYWIKLTGAGDINLPTSLAKSAPVSEYIKSDWGRIILTDAAGKSYTLYSVNGEMNLTQYELPPLPPAGMFDVRYGSQRLAEVIGSEIQTIEMQGIEYPVTVRVEGMTIRVQDEIGKIVNQVIKSGEDVVISNPMVGKLKVSGNVIPETYSLEQNYPNPFNPSTTIEFSIPEDVENVKLTIYDALGQKVAELVNGKLEAGRYSYQWDASKLASGLYIYQLQTNKFISTKKMMLMK